MSPWGKFYLEHFAYNPGWWEPFESWRMNWMIRHVSDTWFSVGTIGFERIAQHLDALTYQLQHSSWRFPGTQLSPDWQYPNPYGNPPEGTL